MSVEIGELTIRDRDGETWIFCKGTVASGGLRSVKFDVPIDQINITVHPTSIGNCQCKDRIMLPGEKGYYCFSKK